MFSTSFVSEEDGQRTDHQWTFCYTNCKGFGGILMYKMIAFDLDGTVAETFPVIFDSFRKIVYKYTHKRIDDQTILATFGANEIGMLNQLIPNAPDKILNEFYQQYRDSHATLTEPFSGINSLIDMLAAHHMQTPMVTGKGSVSCRISLETLGLQNRFSPILIGSSTGPNKSENFQRLLSQYQLGSDQMAYVADTVGDIESCRAVGIDCYSAAWSKYADVDKLQEANATIFRSVNRLNDFLKKMI
ncbi:HAD family hydrolase [Lentilactobacillus hilgardii]|nr:HAD family hydrolase [Lentilactobacillus hilgardii]